MAAAGKTRMKPMNEFDPSRACVVHDLLRDENFEWLPITALNYRRRTVQGDGGTVEFEDVILDGWDNLPTALSLGTRHPSHSDDRRISSNTRDAHVQSTHANKSRPAI
jgi:hypothetical protein